MASLWALLLSIGDFPKNIYTKKAAAFDPTTCLAKFPRLLEHCHVDPLVLSLDHLNIAMTKKNLKIKNKKNQKEKANKQINKQTKLRNNGKQQDSIDFPGGKI